MSTFGPEFGEAAMKIVTGDTIFSDQVVGLLWEAERQAEAAAKLVEAVRRFECECDSYHGVTCGRCQALAAYEGAGRHGSE